MPGVSSINFCQKLGTVGAAASSLGGVVGRPTASRCYPVVAAVRSDGCLRRMLSRCFNRSYRPWKRPQPRGGAHQAGANAKVVLTNGTTEGDPPIAMPRQGDWFPAFQFWRPSSGFVADAGAGQRCQTDAGGAPPPLSAGWSEGRGAGSRPGCAPPQPDGARPCSTKKKRGRQPGDPANRDDDLVRQPAPSR
jgi:hypothetical protein